jgi:hypothetical protein
VADPAAAVMGLAAHLGLSLAPGESEAVAAEFSLEANRLRTEAVRASLEARGLDLSDPAHRLRYDPATLLHWNHLRDGQAGGWRHSLDPAQLALIDRLGGRDWLARRGYEPSGPAGEAWPPGSAWRAARSWWACRVYFTARQHPHLASGLRRALGLGPLNAAPAPAAPPAEAPRVDRA